jgi:uncharacterized membrane protein YhhN
MQFLRKLIPRPDVDFLIVALAHLFALWNDYLFFSQATKAMLLPLLLFWMWPLTAKLPWLRFALVASWLGDLLLLKGEDEMFFMFGLGSFLMAQLAYAYAFSRSSDNKKGLLRQKPYLVLPVLVLAVAIYMYLQPHLGELFVPVSIYVMAITAMVLSAINRRGLAPKGSGVLIAAVFSFMLSDTLLAVDKFVVHIPYASVWIMLSYCLAQFGIARSYWLALKSPD